MVIGDFHVIGVPFVPPKTDAPLVVDAYGVLTGSVAVQRMKPVSWRHGHVLEDLGSVDDQQLSMSPPVNVLRNSTGVLSSEHQLRLLVREGLDHTAILAQCANSVKRYVRGAAVICVAEPAPVGLAFLSWVDPPPTNRRHQSRTFSINTVLGSSRYDPNAPRRTYAYFA